jgi:hypothetical protein
MQLKGGEKNSPSYALGGFPLWKALELSAPADNNLWTTLEIQSINKTGLRRRADIKTYYFLFKAWDETCVFVCEKNDLDQYVVITCWELEPEKYVEEPIKMSKKKLRKLKKKMDNKVTEEYIKMGYTYLEDYLKGK